MGFKDKLDYGLNKITYDENKMAKIESRIDSLGKKPDLIDKILGTADDTKAAEERWEEWSDEERQKIAAKLQESYPGFHYLFMSTATRYKRFSRLSRYIGIADQRLGDSKDGYVFFDIDEQPKYYAMGGWNRHLQHIRLYDMANKEVGSLSEQRVSIHSPIDSNPADFAIKVHGKNLGKISTKTRLKDLLPKEWLNQKLVLKSKDWEIVRGLKHIKIYDKDKEIIAELTDNFLGADFICYANEEDAPLIAMIALTLSALKRRRERKGQMI